MAFDGPAQELNDYENCSDFAIYGTNPSVWENIIHNIHGESKAESNIHRCNIKILPNFQKTGEEKLLNAIENLGVILGGEGSVRRKQSKETILPGKVCTNGNKAFSELVR